VASVLFISTGDCQYFKVRGEPRSSYVYLYLQQNAVCGP